MARLAFHLTTERRPEAPNPRPQPGSVADCAARRPRLRLSRQVRRRTAHGA